MKNLDFRMYHVYLDMENYGNNTRSPLYSAITNKIINWFDVDPDDIGDRLPFREQILRCGVGNRYHQYILDNNLYVKE